jgi:hypothetical protein
MNEQPAPCGLFAWVPQHGGGGLILSAYLLRAKLSLREPKHASTKPTRHDHTIGTAMRLITSATIPKEKISPRQVLCWEDFRHR